MNVLAANLNPFDNIPLELPITLGEDIAGVVTEIGTNVTGLTIDDVVYGQASLVDETGGALTEFAATKVS